MDLNQLLDAQAAALVGGGTMLATLLRCGWHDCRTALTGVAGLALPTPGEAALRADLAPQIARLHRDGVFRAELPHSPDPALAAATAALTHTRTLDGLAAGAERERQRDLDRCTAAVRTLVQAADLAPVAGLAGTLVALSQLPAQSLVHGRFLGAISLSVLTTLYGLVLAHVVLAPLARAIERRAARADQARAAALTWFAGQIAADVPPPAERSR